MLHRIENVAPEGNGRRMRLRFTDGSEGTIDLADTIALGGVFSRLADEATFQQVSIGPGGRWIEWPGGIDLCADALYESLVASAR